MQELALLCRRSSPSSVLIANMILVDFDKDGRLPPPGTVIRFNTTKPNLPVDRFVFHTKGVEYRQDLARQEIERITVFPNPYYARNRQKVGSTDRSVIFSHLPERATIRILTLAGDLVRKLEHNTPACSSGGIYAAGREGPSPVGSIWCTSRCPG